MSHLTDQQKKLLRSIDTHNKKYGVPPTIQFLAEVMDVSYSNIAQSLSALRKKRVLSYRPRVCDFKILIPDEEFQI